MNHLRQILLLAAFMALAAAPIARAQTPAPPAQPSSTEEEPKSLFDQTWHQLQIGGRFSSIDGDPARFQRYQDMRDGLLFTDFRYGKDDPSGLWLFRATADNVGYHDQRYTAAYDRVGTLKITGLWDEIPQFYSVDTKTPYTGSGGTLLLDDATQQKAQNGGGLNVWVPLAP